MSIPLGIMASGHVAAAAGFSPADITGLHAWFDASQITGLSDGDSVATWADASGNSRDATGSAPIYKTGIFNGEPVVRFDGVDDELSTAAWTAISQPNTAFVVCDGMGAFPVYAFDGLSSGARHALLSVNTGLTAFAGESFTIDNPPTGTNVLQVTFNGSSSVGRIGGGGGTSGNAGAHQLTGLTLGSRFSGSDFLAGDIAEIILYNAALSLAEINDVGDYLSAKYALTWTEAI